MRVKNQKSTEKHTSFDGLIHEDLDLSDIYLAVRSTLINLDCCLNAYCIFQTQQRTDK